MARPARGGPIPLHMAITTLGMVAYAVGYLHQRGIIHRDIKPSNVKLRPDEGSSVAKRVQDLVERCVASISANNAARAGQLLHGDTRGLMSAINDGRIQSASSGSVSVAGSEGHFRVNISWTRAFGGTKTTVARMTADLSRGCVVESGGGVG